MFEAYLNEVEFLNALFRKHPKIEILHFFCYKAVYSKLFSLLGNIEESLVVLGSIPREVGRALEYCKCYVYSIVFFTSLFESVIDPCTLEIHRMDHYPLLITCS